MIPGGVQGSITGEWSEGVPVGLSVGLGILVGIDAVEVANLNHIPDRKGDVIDVSDRVLSSEKKTVEPGEIDSGACSIGDWRASKKGGEEG
jgi:hypothetical protein